MTDSRRPPLGRVRDRLQAHRRPILLGAGAVVLLGTLLLGFGLGQLLFPRTVVAAPGDTSAIDTSPTDAAVPAAVMPDLLGLDETSARRVLADAGLNPEVTIDEEPAAGPPGVVVGQEPAAGSAGQVSAVRIALSTPSTVPDLVGRTAHEARTALEALGAVVTVIRVVQPAAADGVVLGVEPAAGAALGGVVELTVADAGAALSLGGLPRVDSSGCSEIASGTVNGSAFSDSLGCRPRSTDAFAEWTLGRHGSVLESTVGLLDSGRTGSARIQIVGDGVVLVDQQVDFGTATALSVDVRGVLRLSVRVVGSGGSADGPTVVFGNGIVRAAPDEIELIRAGS